MKQRYPSHQPPNPRIAERTPGQIAGHIVIAATLITMFLWCLTMLIV